MISQENLGGKALKDALNLSSIYYAGYTTKEKGEAKHESGPFITMLFVESGKLTVRYQGDNLEVKENHLVFIPPSTPCLIDSQTRTRTFACSFSVISRIPLDIFDKTYFATGLKLPLLKRLTRASNVAFNKRSTKKPSAIDEHLIKNCIEFILIECVKPADKSIIDSNYPIIGKGETAKVATAVLDYLSQNIHKNISLEEVADELFFSVSYVKTAFKKHTGKPIMQAFNELKIKRAQKLIKKGLHFAQIAKELGFSSEQYFSKVFKSVLGMTPSEYKKSLIK
jgi:AraC-like DNA-binding protein